MEALKSLGQLKSLCKNKDYKKYIFSVEDQKCDLINNFGLISTFTSIFISINPNMIVLRNASTTLFFKKITKVEYQECSSVLGDMLIIYCEDTTHCNINSESKYYIVACGC